MNDKSTLIYSYGYGNTLTLDTITYKYYITIIYKSDVIKASNRSIHYQPYNRFRIKLDQKGIRFNVYKPI